MAKVSLRVAALLLGIHSVLFSQEFPMSGTLTKWDENSDAETQRRGAFFLIRVLKLFL